MYKGKNAPSPAAVDPILQTRQRRDAYNIIEGKYITTASLIYYNSGYYNAWI